MDSLPSPELIDVLIKGLERIGVPTAMVFLLLWFFVKRGGGQSPSANGIGSGWQQKTDADLKAMRQMIEAHESLWRQRFELHHDKIVIMEAKLAPLFQTFDRRLAELLHQPHPEASEVDALLEKYQAGPETLSDGELNQLITHIHQRYERVKSSTAAPDQSMALTATLYLAILDGLRASRRLQRDLDAREAAMEAQRQQLIAMLDAAQKADAASPWWARLRSWLWGDAS